jgi:hypothetical protein
MWKCGNVEMWKCENVKMWRRWEEVKTSQWEDGKKIDRCGMEVYYKIPCDLRISARSACFFE